MNKALEECLQAAGLTCMPEPLMPTADVIWIRGIAKLRTAYGETFAIVENDGYKPIIKQIFGPSAAILGVVEVYPYMQVSKRYYPTFINDGQIKQFLMRNKFDEATIDKLLSTYGKTQQQIADDRMEIRRKINEIVYRMAAEIQDDDKRQIQKHNDGKAIKERTKGRKKKSA